MTLLDSLLLASGGIAAGFLNTVAGGGGVISVPILTGIVGPTVANGSLRLGILLQSIAGVAGWQRGRAIPWPATLRLVAPTVGGAGTGAWLATLASAGFMRAAFVAAIVLVAVSVLVQPSRWVSTAEPRLREPWRTLVFAGIGLYGGFVQVGVGLPLLVALVPGLGLGLVRGNAAKTFLILCTTPLTLALFALAGQVDWAAGSVLGAGSMVGALVASHLALREGAAAWIRWVVVAAALGAAIQMLFFS
jgi:uncharacterized membrane protein YfcA